MCDFTGWRNRGMRWCLNKRCHIKSFLCGCVPGIHSNWGISCFLQGGGTSKHVILQGGGTYGLGGV